MKTRRPSLLDLQATPLNRIKVLDTELWSRLCKIRIEERASLVAEGGSEDDGDRAEIETETDVDVPVDAIPELVPTLERARLDAVLEHANIGSNSREILERFASSVDALTNTRLTQLVDDGVLDGPQARRVGLATAAVRIAQDIPVTTSTVLDTVRDEPNRLLAFGPREWAERLRANIEDLSNEELDQMSTALSDHWASADPRGAFFARLPATSADDLRDALATLLSRRAPEHRGHLEGPFEALGDESDSKAKRDAAERAHHVLTEADGLYPGARMAAKVNKSNADANAIANDLAAHVRAIARVHEERPDLDLLALDYSTNSADLDRVDLAGLTFDEDERRAVLETLRTHQRMYALAGDVDEAQHLLRAGFRSAVAVGTQRRGDRSACARRHDHGGPGDSCSGARDGGRNRRNDRHGGRDLGQSLRLVERG